MIRPAQVGDLAQLMALWEEAFGDGPAQTRLFFARHSLQDMLVYVQEDTVHAMLCMLPMALRVGGQCLPARYVYGVATSLARRGQGLASQLLESSHAVMQQQDIAASVLAPASESLRAFYEKRGYNAGFWAQHIKVAASQIVPPPASAHITPAEACQYLAVRSAAFAASSLFAAWDEGAIAYALEATRAYGGEAYCFSLGEKTGCALCEMEAQGARIVEMALSGLDVQTALSILHAALQKTAYSLRLAQDTLPGAPADVLGMMHAFKPLPPLSGAPPYLGLIMD